MDNEFDNSNNTPCGLGSTSLGQKASQMKTKSMIRSDWYTVRSEPEGSNPNEKKSYSEVILAKTAINREILQRLNSLA